MLYHSHLRCRIKWNRESSSGLSEAFSLILFSHPNLSPCILQHFSDKKSSCPSQKIILLHIIAKFFMVLSDSEGLSLICYWLTGMKGKGENLRKTHLLKNVLTVQIMQMFILTLILTSSTWSVLKIRKIDVNGMQVSDKSLVKAK